MSITVPVSGESSTRTSMRTIFITVPFLLIAGVVSAQDLQHLGNFDNVSSNDGGEHCAGYSLGLWKHRNEVIGLLDVHAGLCGDPPCAVIRDAALDPKTGRLRFSSSINGQKIQFRGTMTRGAVDGVFNGEPARLVLDREGTSDDFEADRTLPAWCKFWGSVPRCSGVQDLCESINVPGTGNRR
jgi:hypothetical protein